MKVDHERWWTVDRWGLIVESWLPVATLAGRQPMTQSATCLRSRRLLPSDCTLLPDCRAIVLIPTRGIHIQVRPGCHCSPPDILPSHRSHFSSINKNVARDAPWLPYHVNQGVRSWRVKAVGASPPFHTKMAGFERTKLMKKQSRIYKINTRV